MKHLTALILMALSLSLSTAYAQGGRGMMQGSGPGGWGMGCAYCQGFDLKNMTTLEGRVEKAEMLTPARGMAQGVHLLLNTDSGTVPVHLGPQWYIENQEVTIKAGDSIKVSGVKTTYDGKPAVIAFEIEKDDKVLTLRDTEGRPVWAGWRGRGARRGM